MRSSKQLPILCVSEMNEWNERNEEEEEVEEVGKEEEDEDEDEEEEEKSQKIDFRRMACHCGRLLVLHLTTEQEE